MGGFFLVLGAIKVLNGEPSFEEDVKFLLLLILGVSLAILNDLRSKARNG